MKENFFQIYLSSKHQSSIKKNDNISKIFSDLNCITYTFREIKKEFYKDSSNKVFKAFEHVNAYAFKADILRYYLLYKYGGWYSDLNNVFTGKKINTNDINFFAFREMVEGHSPEKAIQNSIIYSKKGDPIIKEALDISIKNVLNNFYGESALDVSGPKVLGYSVYKNHLNPESLGKFTFDQNKQRVFLLPNNEIFATYKANGYNAGDSGIEGGNNYNDLWLSKKLYG